MPYIYNHRNFEFRFDSKTKDYKFDSIEEL